MIAIVLMLNFLNSLIAILPTALLAALRTTQSAFTFFAISKNPTTVNGFIKGLQ